MRDGMNDGQHSRTCVHVRRFEATLLHACPGEESPHSENAERTPNWSIKRVQGCREHTKRLDSTFFAPVHYGAKRNQVFTVLLS